MAPPIPKDWEVLQEAIQGRVMDAVRQEIEPVKQAIDIALPLMENLKLGQRLEAKMDAQGKKIDNLTTEVNQSNLAFALLQQTCTDMQTRIVSLESWRQARETERLHREGVYKAAGAVSRNKWLWSIGGITAAVWSVASGTWERFLDAVATAWR